MYLPRILEQSLDRAMGLFPVVVVTGARRTGKSTLVQSSPALRERQVITLDSPEAMSMALEEPRAFLSQLSAGGGLTIDEVQRVPSLLLSVKEEVDKNKAPGRIILTGSANLLMMKAVADSLAGRARYLTLWPMTRREQLGLGTAGNWTEIIESDVMSWPELMNKSSAPRENWKDVVLRGGYPQAALDFPEREQGEIRNELFAGYAQTYLERDLRDLSDISSLTDFRRLMRAVCLQLGGFVAQTELARDVGIPRTTVQRYLNLLEVSYQLVRLEAFTVNRTKRLMKSPKYYWSDTGLALYLAGLTEPTGAHLENMIVTDLLAWKETQASRPEVLYWRTASGEEVDIVVEYKGKLLPIEVKATSNPGYKDAKHLRTFVNEYKDETVGALLLHDGDTTFWISEKVLAAPWWKVC